MYGKLETRTFLAMLVGVSLAFILLMKPFFGPIFWAVAIALIFHPVREYLARRLGDRPNTIALLTLLICMVIVVIPVLALVTSLVAEGLSLYQRIQEGQLRPGDYIDRVIQSFPAIESFFAQFGLDFAEVRDRVVSGFVGAVSFWRNRRSVLGRIRFSSFWGWR